MRIFRVIPALLCTAALLAACGGESREKAAARRELQRTRCVAEELALQAKERLATLDTLLARSLGSPMEGTASASHVFAAAMKAHADSAARSAAMMDSAMTTRSAEDSARYTAAAMRIRPPAASPGTVEQNVAAEYSREMTRALGNPAHPCNQPEEKS